MTPPGATPQGPHLLVGLGEGQPHTFVGGAAIPRRTGLASEARAGVDAADPREAGMGVTLEDKGHGGSEDAELLRSAPSPPSGALRFLWLGVRESKGHQPALWRGDDTGRGGHRSGGQTRLCLVGGRGGTRGGEGTPGGGCSWDPVGWVVMGGGRNCEGDRPQRRGGVVVGVCVPFGRGVVGADSPRRWKGRWGCRASGVRGVVGVDHSRR